ncbi:MAG: hypothetical protein BWY09_00672 [Candidatus Hydrogenedentes bacterium ADurb.Bin179]|nr:MAG: hypothetical protein BWY09_00672 [Candidatus Hydrogenedentes bacterium ADurb.Bin179]
MSKDVTPVNNRYDFVYLFDCKDGNPNGDPDMANTPRFDPETFQGLVSDVCLKRKIRDYVRVAAQDDPKLASDRYMIYVQQGTSLEEQQRMPYEQIEGLKGKALKSKTDKKDVEIARDWMCEHFFDIRSFGAVMSVTDFNCGQVRGPIQITFARSVDRILATEHGITRVAYTTQAKHDATSAQTEMGNKNTIAYGLYVAHGFINPYLAEQTGFNEADLTLLWRALQNMFDLDRSAARGLMACRGLKVFKHESKLGNHPAHKLFERIRIALITDVETPRSFDDYMVFVDKDKMPQGIQFIDMA